MAGDCAEQTTVDPYWWVRAVVPYDAVDPLEDAYRDHYRSLAAALDLVHHHIHPYAIDAVSGGSVAVVSCPVVAVAVYFCLVHDSCRRLAVPADPNSVDMVEIANGVQHDLASVGQDIGRVPLAYCSMAAVVQLAEVHNYQDTEAEASNCLCGLSKAKEKQIKMFEKTSSTQRCTAGCTSYG